MGSVGMDDNETRCFTNWFKNLAQYRNGQVGDVNVYKGQYIDNIYYWTDQKPRIFFSSEDLKILTPAAYEAYERAIKFKDCCSTGI